MRTHKHIKLPYQILGPLESVFSTQTGCPGSQAEVFLQMNKLPQNLIYVWKGTRWILGVGGIQ